MLSSLAASPVLLLAAFGVAAAVLTALLTPLAMRIAIAAGAVDKPSARRVHQTPTPRMGGLALVATFAILGVAAMYLFPAMFANKTKFLAILAGALVVAAVGIIDDIWSLGSWTKLAAQVAVAVLLFFAGVRIEAITAPFGDGERIVLGLWGLPIAILWFAGLMNAVNLIDGLDGLCSGISGIASFVLAALVIQWDKSFIALIPAITAGMCLGFLFHNFHPARVFLGDTGSLLLGYLLAVTTLSTGTKSSAVFTLLIPMLCIAVPVADTAFAIVRRLMRGQSPFQPDREHIHHRLLNLGLSQQRVVFILWFLTAYLGLTAYTLQKANAPMLTLANGLFLLIGAVLWIENLSFLNVVRDRERASTAAQSKPDSPPGMLPSAR